MNKLKYQYRIYGRHKGRKKIQILNNAFYNNSLINIEKDIKRYIYHLVKERKVSASFQNQAINAIKFYCKLFKGFYSNNNESF